MDWRKEDKKTHRIILFFFIFFVISCAKNYKTIYREINATRDIEQQIEIIGKIKNEFFLYNYSYIIIQKDFFSLIMRGMIHRSII